MEELEHTMHQVLDAVQYLVIVNGLKRFNRGCETATEYEDEESGDGERGGDSEEGEEGSDIELLPPPSQRLNDLSTVYPPEELPKRFA